MLKVDSAIKFVICLCLMAAVSECQQINIYGGNCGQKNDVVAFSVGRKAEFSPTKLTIIPMDHVFTNKGGHFNMTTNRFKAPFSGLYQFNFAAGSDSGKYASLRLHAGNPEVAVGAVYDYGVNWNGASGSTILELKANDTVSLRAYGDHTWKFKLNRHDEISTLFSGFLIQREY